MPSKSCRIVLRHHHRLPAAVRAAFEIRVLDRLVVKSSTERFGRRRDRVMRAQSPILHFLGMSHRPIRRFAAVVAHVAAGRHEAVADVLREPRVRDAAGEPAGAIDLEASGPAAGRRRQPHFELDLGIRRRTRHTFHATERNGHLGAADRCRCGDDRRCRDRRRLGLDRCEARAVRRCVSGRRKCSNTEGDQQRRDTMIPASFQGFALCNRCTTVFLRSVLDRLAELR